MLAPFDTLFELLREGLWRFEGFEGFGGVVRVLVWRLGQGKTPARAGPFDTLFELLREGLCRFVQVCGVLRGLRGWRYISICAG